MSHVEQNHPAGMLVGYARTSTSDQIAGLEDQVIELTKAGCTRIHREHVSAIARHRPALEAALDWVRSGDTFVVTKPDRLARSVTDLLSIVSTLRTKGVTVRILSLNLTSGDPTSDLLMSLMGAISRWEIDIAKERQRAGIAKAKAEGRYKGRAPTARAKAPEVLRLKAEGRTVAEIAKTVGISRASIYRALNEAA